LVQEIAPRIRSSVPGSVSQVGADDIDELVQDGIAIAAVLLTSAHARGKKVTPGNIAYYAIGLLRQGRRSTGLSKTGPLHPAAQLNGRSRMLSLDAVLTNEAEGEEPTCLHDALAAQVEDPATIASRRLDWEKVIQNLDEMAVTVLVWLATGEPLTCLARKLKRHRSTLQKDKARLARAVREHLGQDILQEVQQLPRWRDNLLAFQEKFTCRAERQACDLFTRSAMNPHVGHGLFPVAQKLIVRAQTCESATTQGITF